MGLAASQARFLGVTARKNACELRSMQIAQEKLSITNELAQISEDYQRSLDATRLVWDSEAIEDGSIYDVTYDLLMNPSDLNDYSPQLLTNILNQVVLDDQYAKIFDNDFENVVFNADGTQNYELSKKYSDLTTGGGARTAYNFKAFLGRLNQCGILSKIDLDNMLAAINTDNRLYNADKGLGGFITEKFTANAMNKRNLIKYIKSLTDGSSEYRADVENRHNSGDITMDDLTYNKIIEMANALSFNHNVPYSESPTGPVDVYGTWGQWAAHQYDTGTKENVISFSGNEKFTLANLLEGDVTITASKSAYNDSFNMITASFINMMYNVMNSVFAINPGSVDQDYLNFAMSRICEINGCKWDSTNKKVDTSTFTAPIASSKSAYQHTSIINNNGKYSVSLSNIARETITYFEKAVEGYSEGYKVDSRGDKLIENSYLITDDYDYMYFLKNPEAIDIDERTRLLIDYYTQLFNQICANGWTNKSEVSDKDKLKNMLKNGKLFTSSLADDGHFYQAPYTSNNYIAEVSDKDAIARAEAEYKTKQLKLNAKEEELNIDMQNVDAELAALTTEYDTVKGLISKAIEKGFSTLGGG